MTKERGLSSLTQSSKWWSSHWEDKDEFNKVCLYRFLNPKFSISGDKNVVLLPCTGRVTFIWEFHDLFQGRGVRRMVGGQSDLPASAFFSKSSSLRYSACQVSIVWGSMSWTPQDGNILLLVLLVIVFKNYTVGGYFQQTQWHWIITKK